jgi:betaine-aldehyde dehydrogenase
MNPATGLPISEVADTDPAAVVRVVARARQAYTSWRASTPAVRARLLLRMADLGRGVSTCQRPLWTFDA